ncbi:hypothetical protein BGX29_009037 [Mortierella sp. GBA35]|nr:hypothetical protein BGX29_009037 [Mortierella sp. GBA35]
MMRLSTTLVSWTLVVSLLALSAIPAPASSASSCDKNCSNDVKPVCALLTKTNKMKTFLNECTFKEYRCEHPTHKAEIISYQACPNPLLSPPCLTVACFDTYKPVCVKLGNGEYQTFDSPCWVNLYKCEHNSENISPISGDKACEYL